MLILRIDCDYICISFDIISAEVLQQLYKCYATEWERETTGANGNGRALTGTNGSESQRAPTGANGNGRALTGTNGSESQRAPTGANGNGLAPTGANGNGLAPTGAARTNANGGALPHTHPYGARQGKHSPLPSNGSGLR